MIYFCCDDERRRTKIQEHETLNGIDFLEVRDEQTDPLSQRQRTLLLHFLKADSPAGEQKVSDALATLTTANIVIEGGDRVKNIKVLAVSVNQSEPHILTVRVSTRGDFSTYTLRLVIDANNHQPPPGFDPVLSVVNFTFKVACPSDYDCKTERLCPPADRAQPEIDYLAKDYASFRQLMLDRMALLVPQWRERNVADLGIMLVELLSYAGDYLSYQQDAVATEAYLGTARHRTSIRRHARLVDYVMHDGRNARTWIQFTTGAEGDGLVLEKGAGARTTKLFTRIPGELNSVILQDSPAYVNARNARPLVFELLHDLVLFQAHNEIKFYTWEARNCCLPKGATKATLRDDGPAPLKLRAGDVLIFEERKGPQTGARKDADPAHRHAVMLTRVHPEAQTDVVNGGSPFTDPLTNDRIVEIEWSQADALPFPLCISGETPDGFADDISIALGNVALADHGMTFTDEPEIESFDWQRASSSLTPDTVPEPNPVLAAIAPTDGNHCESPTSRNQAVRYRPKLKRSPLTNAAPFENVASATAALKPSTTNPKQRPVPQVWLSGFTNTSQQEMWRPVRDLLSSLASGKDFAVEVETDGTPYLRFGDDVLGSRPVSGTKFLATYRVGNGTAGNLGADTLAHVVSATITNEKIITAVRNPIRAQGGLEPETIEQVRQNAPSAFRVQERAVTPADYEEIVTRKDLADSCGIDVQRAAATSRWTGSWHTMFVTVDRFGDQKVDADFETKLRNCLERFRIAGEDLEIDAPQYVSLDIEISVCIKPGYYFGDVKRALLDVFSDGVRSNNQRGFFHPDNLSFGQTVYLSSLIAAAQAVAGVDSVMVRKFQRQHVKSDAALNLGKLEFSRLEIARLSNDPNFPERGSFTVTRG